MLCTSFYSYNNYLFYSASGISKTWHWECRIMDGRTYYWLETSQRSIFYYFCDILHLGTSQLTTSLQSSCAIQGKNQTCLEKNISSVASKINHVLQHRKIYVDFNNYLTAFLFQAFMQFQYWKCMLQEKHYCQFGIQLICTRFFFQKLNNQILFFIVPLYIHSAPVLFLILTFLIICPFLGYFGAIAYKIVIVLTEQPWHEVPRGSANHAHSGRILSCFGKGGTGRRKWKEIFCGQVGKRTGRFPL